MKFGARKVGEVAHHFRITGWLIACGRGLGLGGTALAEVRILNTSRSGRRSRG